MLSGKLIALEGIDGSGKATHSRLLFEWYKQSGQAVRLVSFPDYAGESSALVRLYLGGGIASGELSAVNAYAASSFYAADRYISFKNSWESDYNSGLIIADRYTSSNLVHQMAKLPEGDWPEFISWLLDYEHTKLGLPRPDMVIYLDLPVDLAVSLMEARYEGGQHKKDIHERDTSYLAACRRAGIYAAAALGWRCIPSSTYGKLRSIRDIAADIQRLHMHCN